MPERRQPWARNVHSATEPYAVQVDQVSLVNMAQYNVQEAKTRLSELLNMVERGEDVVIAKAGKPVARLVKIERPTKRRLGFVKGQLPDNFLEPMDEEELALWEAPLISSTHMP